MDSSNNKPVALVLGVTGQLGKLSLTDSTRRRRCLARIQQKAASVSQDQRPLWRGCLP